MWDFLRKVKDDGWTSLPEETPAEVDFVGQVLERARDYARVHEVSIGHEFGIVIQGMPADVASRTEILGEIMERASDYGLISGSMIRETALAFFTRVKE